MTLFRENPVGDPSVRVNRSHWYGLTTLMLWLAAMAATSIWTLSVVKYPVFEAYVNGAEPLAVLDTAFRAMSWPHWAILVVGLTAFCLLVWEEVRFGGLRQLIASDGPRLVVLFWILQLFLAHSYLHPGLLLGGDTLSHTERVSVFAMSLGEGVWPIWNNFDYAGSPFLQFTGPLFFWIAGTIAALIGDANASIKLVLLVTQLMSGAGMLALLRRWGLAKLPAIVGALIYSSAWAHVHLMLYKGAFPQAITMALMPYAFLAMDRLIMGPRRFGSYWALLALLSGLQVINHPTNAIAIGVYMAAWLAVCTPSRAVTLRAAVSLATAAAAGAVVTCGVILPMIAEDQRVMINASSPLSLFWLAVPPAEYWRHLFLWNPGLATSGSISAAYLGMVATLLGIAGVFGLGNPRRRRVILVCAALLVFSFFFRGSHVRDVMFSLFWLATLAALGTERLLAWRPKKRMAIAFAVTVLLFTDLASTSIQPLARTDKQKILDAARLLQNEPEGRTVVASVDNGFINVAVGPNAGIAGLARVPMLIGAHNMTATVIHNYIFATLMELQHELNSGIALSKQILDELYLFDVARVIGFGRNNVGLPARLPGSETHSVLGRHLFFPHSPAVAAPRIEAAPPPPADKPLLWEDGTPLATAASAYVRQISDAMKLNHATATADRIFVRQMSALPFPGPAGPIGKITVYAHRVTLENVYLDLAVTDPAYVRLAHVSYPWRTILVDGLPAQHWGDALNMIVLRLEPGRHAIELRATVSLLRATTAAVSGIAFLTILGWFFVARNRERIADLAR